MASSAPPADDAARALGQLLTATEGAEIADRLADGDTLTAALGAVSPGRRAEVRGLLEALGPHVMPVLRAVEGARSLARDLQPLWTMPGHLARGGPLTTSIPRLVDGARSAITCSTFNFQRSSGLWTALSAAAKRPEITLRVYVDTRAADHEPKPWSPTTSEVAAHLRPGRVFRTKHFDGAPIRNHAKFLAVDHRFLLVTSANFSWSAEHGNVEFGVLIDDPNFTEAVESQMRDAEDVLYERTP